MQSREISVAPRRIGGLGGGLMVILAALVFVLAYGLQGSIYAKAAILVGVALASLVSLTRPGVALIVTALAGCFSVAYPVAGLELQVSEMALIAFLPALLKLAASGPLPRGAVRFGVVALVVGHLAAILVARDMGVATWGTVRLFLVVVWASAVYQWVARDTDKRMTTLAVWVTAATFAVAFLGYRQTTGAYALVGPEYVPGRPDSTFGWYSNYANAIAIGALVAFALTLHAATARRLGVTVFGAVTFLLAGYSVLQAASRGAIGLLGIGLLALVMAPLLRRPGRVVVTALAGGLALAALYTLVPADVAQVVTERLTTTQGEDVFRDSMQAGGLAVATQHPVGVGWGNFQVMVEAGEVPFVRARLAHAHELYTQTALDGGWLALLGLLVLLMAAALRGLRSARGRGLQMAFAAGLVGYAAQGTADYFFFETASRMWFAVLVIGALVPATRSVRAATPMLAASASQPAPRGAGRSPASARMPARSVMR